MIRKDVFGGYYCRINRLSRLIADDSKGVRSEKIHITSWIKLDSVKKL